MGGFNTQFHATLGELCDFIEAWLDQHPIIISAFAFPPSTRVAICRDNLREVLARPDIGEVTFTLVPVASAISAASHVGDDGNTSVQLNIGRIKPNGLEQSSFSTGYDDPIWKKLNRDLKRRTTAGATFVNDVTGATHFSRNDRFTPGAKALAASGTPLRELGGKTKRLLPK